MKFSLRHADKLVGIFFLVACVFVITVLVVIGANQRWFARDQRFYTRFTTAAGLSRNQKINLSGFQIGKVIDFTLTPENQVDVTLLVFEEYLDRIRPGSIVELKSSPIGLGSELVLYPGTDTSRVLEPEGFIPERTSAAGRALIDSGLVVLPETTDAISIILDQAVPLMSNLNTALVTLDETLVSIGGLSDELVSGLSGTGDGPIAAVLTDLASITAGADELVRTQIRRSLDDLNETTANIGELSEQISSAEGLVRLLLGAEGSFDTLLDDDNELYASIYTSVEGIEEMIQNFVSMAEGLSRTTPQLASVLNQTMSVLEETRMVMEGIRNNPLIRGGVTEERVPTVEQGGYRDAEF